MSVFILNDPTYFTDDTITYNYPASPINHAKVMSKMDSFKDPFLEIQQLGELSNPNLFVSKNNAVYYTVKWFVYGLLHNNIAGLTAQEPAESYTGAIPDKGIIGELVIEHSSSTNANKVYLCFLLKYPGVAAALLQSTSTIDNILTLTGDNAKSSTVTSVNLNNDIALNKDPAAITYKSNNDTVIVFLDPIVITDNAVGEFSKRTDLFDIFPSIATEYSLISANHIEPSVRVEVLPNANTTPGQFLDKKSGQQHDDNEIYIDCSPSNESSESIRTYSIPTGSDIAGELSAMGFMSMFINFITFIVLIVGVYICVPELYKRLVINKVLALLPNLHFDTGVPDAVKPLLRIRSVDIFITFIVVGIMVSLGSWGKTNNSPILIGSSVFLLFIYILSFCILQYSKTSDDFMTYRGMFAYGKQETTVDDRDALYAQLPMLMLQDLFKYIIQLLEYILAEDRMFGEGFKSRRILILGILTGLFGLIMGLLQKQNKLDLSQGSFDAMMQIMMMYGIPIPFFILVFLWGNTKPTPVPP